MPLRKSPRVVRYGVMAVAIVALFLGGYFLVQRFVLLNLHTIEAGQFYRSAQPTAHLLERLKHDVQLKTILKLNSDNDSSRSRAEEDLAGRLGLRYEYIPLSMSRLPTRDQLLRIIDVLEHAPRPVLIHCNAGADRTGLIGTLAAMLEGQPLSQARSAQLNPIYLHVGLPGEDVTEVLDQFIVDRAMSIKPAETFADFVDYVRNEYYPTFYHARITPLSYSGEGALVQVTNASRWYFARGYKDRYELVAYQWDDKEQRIILDRQPIPSLDPAESVTKQLNYDVKPLEGQPIFFDILRVQVTWFSNRGSPVGSVNTSIQPVGRLFSVPGIAAVGASPMIMQRVFSYN